MQNWNNHILPVIKLENLQTMLLLTEKKNNLKHLQTKFKYLKDNHLSNLVFELVYDLTCRDPNRYFTSTANDVVLVLYTGHPHVKYDVKYDGHQFTPQKFHVYKQFTRILDIQL